MTCTVLTAGVDVGKTFLDLGFHPTGRPVRFKNDVRGVADLIALVKKRGVSCVATEAIGPYAQRLVAGLVAAGVAVSIVDPRRIRAFRTAEGRIAQAVEPESLAGHKAVTNALTAACDEVEDELARRIAADRALARKRAILLSIPGIGARIAPLLITDMPESGALDRKAVASLAGLVPHPNRSGVGPGRDAIAGGRPWIRSAFCMAGMVAARTEPVFKATYKAMREAGKPPKVAIIAMGRRVALLANALLREDKLFEDSKLLKPADQPSGVS